MGIWERLRGRRGESGTQAIDESVAAPVITSCDDAVASSALLSEAGWTTARSALVRHVVSVPPTRSAFVTEQARLDGYRESVERADDPAPPPGQVVVRVARTLTVDARTLSQERSRMASVASRGGGQVIAVMVFR